MSVLPNKPRVKPGSQRSSPSGHLKANVMEVERTWNNAFLVSPPGSGDVFPREAHISSARKILILRDFLLVFGLFGQYDSFQQRWESLLMPHCHGMLQRKGPQDPHRQLLSFFKEGNRSKRWNDLPPGLRSRIPKLPLLYFSNFTTPAKLFGRGKKTFLLHFNFWISISCSSLPTCKLYCQPNSFYYSWHLHGLRACSWVVAHSSLTAVARGRCFIFIYRWAHLGFGHWATLPQITCSASSRARTPAQNSFWAWQALRTLWCVSLAFRPQQDQVWKLL